MFVMTLNKVAIIGWPCRVRRLGLMSALKNSFPKRLNPPLRMLEFEKRDWAYIPKLPGFGVEMLPAVVASEYIGFSCTGLICCEAACVSGSATFYSAYSAIAGDIAMLPSWLASRKWMILILPPSLSLLVEQAIIYTFLKGNFCLDLVKCLTPVS